MEELDDISLHVAEYIKGSYDLMSINFDRIKFARNISIDFNLNGLFSFYYNFMSLCFVRDLQHIFFKQNSLKVIISH